MVAEDRYSKIFRLERVRPAQVVDGLAELQVRWPNVPIVFAESRRLAEEWIYRFLGAAQVWAETEIASVRRLAPLLDTTRTSTATPAGATELDLAPGAPRPSTAEVRAWARGHGFTVSDRGRLRPEVWDAWVAAHHGR